MTDSKILIMEDDEILRDAIADILRDEGYAVDTAGDGPAGLACLNAEKYSLVIMDLKMPRMNGYSLLKQVKTDFPSVKIIVITGSLLNIDDSSGACGPIEEDEAEKRRILKSADSILQKPFDIEKLLACVGEYAR